MTDDPQTRRRIASRAFALCLHSGKCSMHDVMHAIKKVSWPFHLAFDWQWKCKGCHWKNLKCKFPPRKTAQSICRATTRKFFFLYQSYVIGGRNSAESEGERWPITWLPDCRRPKWAKKKKTNFVEHKLSAKETTHEKFFHPFSDTTVESFVTVPTWIAFFSSFGA